MDMAPRDALVPLLKLVGTAAVAAVAYRYGSKHVVAAAHRQHGQHRAANKPMMAADTSSDAKADRTDTAMHVPSKSSSNSAAESVAEQTLAASPPRSSLIMAMVLQDGYLLLSVFGVLVMVLATLVSLAVVALNDAVASVDELQLFAPLMGVGMAFVAVGMLSSMLRSPSASTHRAARTVQRCPFSGAVATTPLPATTKKMTATVGGNDDATELDDDAAPRVSRCPFGFT